LTRLLSLLFLKYNNIDVSKKRNIRILSVTVSNNNMEQQPFKKFKIIWNKLVFFLTSGTSCHYLRVSFISYLNPKLSYYFFTRLAQTKVTLENCMRFVFLFASFLYAVVDNDIWVEHIITCEYEYSRETLGRNGD
jgi:hypothetical protein